MCTKEVYCTWNVGKGKWRVTRCLEVIGDCVREAVPAPNKDGFVLRDHHGKPEENMEVGLSGNATANKWFPLTH